MSAIDQINQGGTTYEIVPEIAELFSIEKTYRAGDHVIYEAGWYTFKTDKYAGAWDATKVDGPFKVTNELSSLKSDLNDGISNLANGYIAFFPDLKHGFLDNNGEETTINIAYVTTGYIAVDTSIEYIPFIADSHFSLKVCLYNSSKTFLERVYITYSDSQSNTYKWADINANAAYFKYAFSTTDKDTNPTFKHGAYFQCKSKIEGEIQKNKNEFVKVLSYPITITEQNGRLNSDGNYTATSSYHSKSTNKISANEGTVFKYSGVGKYSAVSWIFYSGNEIISTGQYEGSTLVTIPSGADGVMFSSFASISDSVSLNVKAITLESRIEQLENDQMQYIYGKKIGFDGDSICYGQGNNGGYAKVLVDEYGIVSENISVAGGTIASGTYYPDENPRHWICESVPNLSSSNDYIVIEGGVNDVWQNVPLGSISSGYSATLDKTTFYGALETICKTLRTTFIGKKVGFLIPHKINSGMATDGAYYDAIYECTNKWGVPLLDLSIMCPPFGFMDSNYQTIKDTYTVNGDGTHPNPLCYSTFYVPKIVDWLLSL